LKANEAQLYNSLNSQVSWRALGSRTFWVPDTDTSESVLGI